MRIENLKSMKNGNRARVVASVTWEDCDRPPHEVYFETGEAFAEDLTCNPNAFLLASIIPAMHYGERRVFVDAEICPELRDNLLAAMSWLRHWFYESERELVQIEAKMRANVPVSRTPERAGMMLSGGIDSLGMLRENRRNFPLEHPGSIRDGFHVYGLELDDPEAFEYVVEYLSGIREASIEYIPVYTNIYLHFREEDARQNFEFWYYKLYGSALASVAHAFSRRLTSVCIASDYDVPRQKPHGSHPLLNLNYSSSDLRIRHKGITLTRLDKTKLVADWDVTLKHIRVCNMFSRYQPGKINCEKCEKCVRTMLALLVLGKLDKTRAFRANDVSRELLQSELDLSRHEYLIMFYEELLAPLAQIGRHDLVRIIEREIARSHKKKIDWKNAVKRFDSRYLDGTMQKLNAWRHGKIERRY
jgi:hypothetical protein